MTSEYRQHLRRLIDQAVRNTLPQTPTCGGCGCPRNEHTRGCEACWKRTRRRAQAAAHAATRRARQICRRCGTPWDQPNPACTTCKERHKKRTGSRRIPLEGTAA